jgi:methionyl-tRNA formyltransferase
VFKVGFIGRGRLGANVFRRLLEDPHVQVPVAITCAATAEVEDTSIEIETLAQKHGVPYFETNNINKPEWPNLLRSYELDLVVAMLWLHTINDAVISTARLGFINSHGGHLPKYRGNACANWAILNGEPHIGTSVHLMTPGSLDDGPVLCQEIVPIDANTYVGELIGELEGRGERLVIDAVEALRTGTAKPARQDPDHASYCYPRLPRDGEIDWNEKAVAVHALVRAAGRPYPGAYCWFQDHRAGGIIRKMTIWRARVEKHGLPEYYAVPGHLLRLESGAKYAVACGDASLLVLEEIAIDGESADAGGYFRTVRQRLGLDVASVTAENSRRLAEMESLGHTASRFVSNHGPALEEMQSDVSSVVDAALTKIPAAIAASPNQLRNWSFQKRWFDWEQRERWFGVQIYRSLCVTKSTGEQFAIGFWRFSNEAGKIERRLYAALDEKFAASAGESLARTFQTVVGAPVVAAHTSTGEVRGLYADVAWPNDQLAQAIADLAQACVSA